MPAKNVELQPKTESAADAWVPQERRGPTAACASEGTVRFGHRPGSGDPAGATGPSVTQLRPLGRTSGHADGAAGEVELSELDRDLLQQWLDWQSRMIAGLVRGAVFIGATDDPRSELTAVGRWPERGPGIPELQAVAAQVALEGRGIVRPRQAYGAEGGRLSDIVACPAFADGRVVAVAAMMLSSRSEAQQGAVLRLLQWGSIWLDVLLRQRAAARRDGMLTVIHLAAISLEAGRIRPVAVRIASELARRLDCDRVGIGLRRGLDVRLLAVSDMVAPPKDSELVHALERAMAEAIDQAQTIVWPQEGASGRPITTAHEGLRQAQGSRGICTVPLSHEGRPIGAISLERKDDRPFTAAEVQVCEAAAALIGPALELKRRESRPALAKLADSSAQGIKTVLGRRYWRAKLIGLAALALALVLGTQSGAYRVTAPAVLEAVMQRVVVAPQVGYLAAAEVRAGDLVEAGQEMASLDGVQLALERDKLKSRKDAVSSEYHEAMARLDRTRLAILGAEAEQASAELKLVEDQLARLAIRSPISGVVVSGDLSQSLGAPLERGQTLFEVAPLDAYRVVLKVDERDLRAVQQGQGGALVLAGLPSRALLFKVSQLTPVAISEDGSNYFRVEAVLEDDGAELRPGMRGYAKIDAGERPLWWLWTHALWERVRILLWPHIG